MAKWYASYYEEYPIYEPAEGGYYYAGLRLIEVKPFKKYHQARKYLARQAKELGMVCGGPDFWMLAGNKYIGEGAECILEKRMGSHQKGHEPYC